MEKMRPRVIATAYVLASGILGVALSAGLTGCVDFYRQSRDFQDGWRTGEIVEIGRANEIQRGGRTDCRKTASADDLAVQHFAVLVDRSTGQRHAHIVMLILRRPSSWAMSSRPTSSGAAHPFACCRMHERLVADAASTRPPAIFAASPSQT
jgi:hypothetical protein